MKSDHYRYLSQYTNGMEGIKIVKLCSNQFLRGKKFIK